MALCATTALAGAVSRLCVRGARGRFGGVRAGTWCCVSPSSPFPPRVFRAACGGPSRPGVPYPRSLVRHSMRSVRSARSVRLPFLWSPRVLFVCVRSRSRGVRSPLGGVARASRVVPALGAGRAVPCGPCPSACPAPVPCSVWRAWGGAVWSRFPPTWLGVVGAAAGRPRGGAFDRCVGRSGSCAPLPPTARPLGGLSGSALWARACGCGGPALFLRGGREVSAWCPGAGPPDSHDEPDAHGASPRGMRGGVGVTVAGVVHQCSGSWPSRAPLPRAYSLHRGRGLRARLFCDPGASVSQKAAAPEVAHQARAAKELVRTPGSVVSHRSLRIPDEASHRPVRVQLTVRTAAGVGGSHVFCFSPVGGKTNETSTRSTGIGGGAGCWRGGWFPRRQLESSTCRDPRSTNAWDRTPALDD